MVFRDGDGEARRRLGSELFRARLATRGGGGVLAATGVRLGEGGIRLGKDEDSDVRGLAHARTGEGDFVRVVYAKGLLLLLLALPLILVMFELLFPLPVSVAQRGTDDARFSTLATLVAVGFS